jgi:hypothetical protein
VFIDRAPCTKLHKREQKDRTKILAEIPKHGLKDHGADKINIQFIKDSLEVILDPVTDIINCSLTTSTYPSKWKMQK